MNYYILEGTTPIRCEDLQAWGRWLNENQDKKRVAKDDIGAYWVSTVFLGLDHSFGDGPPVLFETMVFPHDSFSEEYCERCSTWEEALIQHQAGIEFAKGLRQ